MINGNLEDYLLMIPVLLISLTVHEFAHGYTAYRLGDPTAKEAGRLSLNPFRHLDPVGTIMLIIARIGWAKPVPINPVYFRDRKKGTVLVSVAGPISNLLLAFIGVLLYRITAVIEAGKTIKTGSFTYYFLSFLLAFIITNINLAVFNLIPAPPLDGSKILYGVLPADKYFGYMRYERYIGMAFLVIFLLAPSAVNRVISFFTEPILDSMVWCTDWIIGLFL